MPNLTTSEAGKLHIKTEENAPLLTKSDETFVDAYFDSNGYAIGWGTRYDMDGSPITKDQSARISYCKQLFNRDVAAAAATVNSKVTASLKQGQFDALVDFVYQFGASRLASSTLLKVVNATPNDLQAVATEFRKWINVNGKPNAVLIARREKNILQYGSGAVNQSTLVWVILVLVIAFIFYRTRIK
jgi:lysozyme